MSYVPNSLAVGEIDPLTGIRPHDIDTVSLNGEIIKTATAYNISEGWVDLTYGCCASGRIHGLVEVTLKERGQMKAVAYEAIRRHDEERAMIAKTFSMFALPPALKVGFMIYGAAMFVVTIGLAVAKALS